MYIRQLVSIAVALSLAILMTAHGADIDCPNSESSLIEVLQCTYDAIIPRETGTWQPPSPATRGAFSALISAVATQRSCSAEFFGVELSPYFKMMLYNDSNIFYCIIYEYQDENNDGIFDHGYGLYIISMEEISVPLAIEIPHPKYDTKSSELGIAAFVQLRARYFCITGAHRHAILEESPCQDQYYAADAAHSNSTIFYSFSKTIYDIHKLNVTHLQFHVMGTSTCPDVNVFVSNGFSLPPAPYSEATRIVEEMRIANPTWNISLPQDPVDCKLLATSNVMGRVVNGVPEQESCYTKSDSSALNTSAFIHIEQESTYIVQINPWIESLKKVYNYSALVLELSSGPTDDEIGGDDDDESEDPPEKKGSTEMSWTIEIIAVCCAVGIILSVCGVYFVRNREISFFSADKGTTTKTIPIAVRSELQMENPS